MTAQKTDQLALDERVVADDRLEGLLEDWQEAREGVSEARSNLRGIQSTVDAEIERLDLGIDTAVRVGRFRIARKMRPPRDVEFHTEAKDSIKIALVDEAA